MNSTPAPDLQEEYSEQWALACGEILRILTHYNRPIYKVDRHHSEANKSNSGTHATTSNFVDGESVLPPVQNEKKPLWPLSPWITNLLLVAPLLEAITFVVIATSRGAGKYPQLIPSTPRWAVANGTGVILSVCDEEVARYETATLTAAAVPALLLPPPMTSMDEHLVAGLPTLEPYARLFHS